MGEQEIVRSTRGLKNRRRKGRAGLLKKVTICLASIICCLSFVAVGVIASLTDLPVVIDNDVYYYATAFNKNDSDEFIIETYEDLVMMSNLVNNGVKIPDTNISYQDAKYIVINDINPKKNSEDNATYSLNPIGTGSNPFRGVFNGGGHTISNVTIAQTVGAFYVGLFGCAEGAEIYGVGIGTVASPKSCTYSFNINQTGSFAYGGIVGYAKAKADGTQTSVHDCYNYADISVMVASGISPTLLAVGGIVGNSDGCSIVNCYNTGDITASKQGSTTAETIYTAGISCLFDSSSTTQSVVSNSYNLGTISGVPTTSGYSNSACIALGTGTKITGTANYAIENCLQTSGTSREIYSNVRVLDIANMSGEDALTNSSKMNKLNTDLGQNHWSACCDTGDEYKFPQLLIFEKTYTSDTDEANHTDYYNHYGIIKTIEIKSFHNFLYDPYGCDRYYHNFSNKGGNKLAIAGTTISNATSSEFTNTINSTYPNADSISNWLFKLNSTFTITATPVTGFDFVGFILVQGTEDCSSNFFTVSGSTVTRYAGATSGDALATDGVINFISGTNTLTLTAKRSGNTGVMVYGANEYRQVFALFTPKSYTCADLAGKFSFEVQDTDGTIYNAQKAVTTATTADISQILCGTTYGYTIEPNNQSTTVNSTKIYNYKLQAIGTAEKFYFSDYAGSASYNSSEEYHTITLRSNLKDMLGDKYSANAPAYIFDGFYSQDYPVTSRTKITKGSPITKTLDYSINLVQTIKDGKVAYKILDGSTLSTNTYSKIVAYYTSNYAVVTAELCTYGDGDTSFNPNNRQPILAREGNHGYQTALFTNEPCLSTSGNYKVMACSGNGAFIDVDEQTTSCTSIMGFTIYIKAYDCYGYEFDGFYLENGNQVPYTKKTDTEGSPAEDGSDPSFATSEITTTSATQTIYVVYKLKTTSITINSLLTDELNGQTISVTKDSTSTDKNNFINTFGYFHIDQMWYEIYDAVGGKSTRIKADYEEKSASLEVTGITSYGKVFFKVTTLPGYKLEGIYTSSNITAETTYKYNFSISELEGTAGDYIICLNGEKIYAKLGEDTACTTLETNEVWLNFVPDNTTVNFGTAYEFEDEIGKYVSGNGGNMFGGTVSVEGFRASYQGVTEFAGVDVSGSAMPVGVLVANTTAYNITLTATAKTGFNFVGFFGLTSAGGSFVDKSTLDNNTTFYPSTIANTETLKLLNTSSQEYGTRIYKDTSITCTASNGSISFDNNSYTAIYALFERAEVTITAFLHSQRGTEACSSLGGYATVSGPSVNNTVVADPNLSTNKADGTCADVSFRVKYLEWFRVTPTAKSGYKFIGYYATVDDGDAEIDLSKVDDYQLGDGTVLGAEGNWDYNVLLRAFLPQEEIDGGGQIFYQNQATCIAVPCIGLGDGSDDGAFLFDGIYYTYTHKGSSYNYNQLYARFEKIPIENFAHSAYGNSGADMTHTSTMNTNTKEVIGNTTLEYTSGRFKGQTASTYTAGETYCKCISLIGDEEDTVIIYAERMYGFQFVGFYYKTGGETLYSMLKYPITITDDNGITTTRYYAGSESKITTFEITSNGIANSEVSGDITQIYAVYRPLTYNIEYQKNSIDINGNPLIYYDSVEGEVKSGSEVVTFNKLDSSKNYSMPQETSHAYATPGSALSSNASNDPKGYYTASGYTFIGWGYYDEDGKLEIALIREDSDYDISLLGNNVSAFKTNKLIETQIGTTLYSLPDDLFPASGSSVNTLKALWVPNNDDIYRGKTYLVLHTGGDCDITTYKTTGMSYGYDKQIPLIYGATLVIENYKSQIESAISNFFTHNAGFEVAGFSIDGGAVVHYGLSDFIYLDSENITLTDNKNNLLLNITSAASLGADDKPLPPSSHPFCTIEPRGENDTIPEDACRYIHLYAVFKKTINFYQGTVEQDENNANYGEFIDENRTYGTILSHDYLFDYTATGEQTLKLPVQDPKLEYQGYYFKIGDYIGGVVAMSDIMTSSSAPYTYNTSNAINGTTTKPNFLNNSSGGITHGTSSATMDVCLIYAKQITGSYITGINKGLTAYSTSLSDTKTYYYYKLLPKQEITDPFDAKTKIDNLGVNLSFYGYNSNYTFYPSNSAPDDMLTTTYPYSITLTSASTSISGVYVGNSKVKVIGPPTDTTKTQTALTTLATQNKTYTFSGSNNFVDFDSLASLVGYPIFVSNTNIYFSPMYINNQDYYKLVLPTVTDASFGNTNTEKDYYSFDGWAIEGLLNNGWYATETANSGKVNYWFYSYDYDYEFSDGTVGRQHYVSYNNTPQNLSPNDSEADQYKIFVLPGTTLSLYPVFRYHEVSAGFTDDQTTLIFDNSSGLELVSFGYTYGSISNRWTYNPSTHKFEGYIPWLGALQKSGITFRIKNTTSAPIYFNPNYSYTSTNGVYLTGDATYKSENSSTTYNYTTGSIVLEAGVVYDFTFKISDVGNASGSLSDNISASLQPQWSTTESGTYLKCFKEPEITSTSATMGKFTPDSGNNYLYGDGYITLTGTSSFVWFYIENDDTTYTRYYTIEILDNNGNDVSSLVTISVTNANTGEKIDSSNESSNEFGFGAGVKAKVEISYSGTNSTFTITPYGGVYSGHKYEKLFSLVASSGGVKEGSTVSFVSGYTANANTNGVTTSWTLTNAQTGKQYPIYTDDNYTETIIADSVCVTVKNIHPAFILLNPTLVDASDKEIIFNINNGASFTETRTSNSATTNVSALTLTAYGDLSSNATMGLDGRVYLTSSAITYYITAQKTNCKFLGWYTKPEGGVKILDSEGKFNTANGCEAVAGYIDENGRWNTANTINLYAHYSSPEYVLVICNNNYDCSIATKHDHSAIDISSIPEINSSTMQKNAEGLVTSYSVDGIVDYRVYFIENEGYFLTRSTDTDGNYKYSNQLAKIVQPTKTSWTFTGFKYIGQSDFEYSIFTDNLTVPSGTDAWLPPFKTNEEHPVIYATWTPIYVTITLNASAIPIQFSPITFGGGNFQGGSTSKTIYVLKEGVSSKIFSDPECTTEIDVLSYVNYIPTKNSTIDYSFAFNSWAVFNGAQASDYSCLSLLNYDGYVPSFTSISNEYISGNTVVFAGKTYLKNDGSNNSLWYCPDTSSFTLYAIYNCNKSPRNNYLVHAIYGTDTITIKNSGYDKNILDLKLAYETASPYTLTGLTTFKYCGKSRSKKVLTEEELATEEYNWLCDITYSGSAITVTRYNAVTVDGINDVYFYLIVPNVNEDGSRDEVYIYISLPYFSGAKDYQITYTAKTTGLEDGYIVSANAWYYTSSSSLDNLIGSSLESTIENPISYSAKKVNKYFYLMSNPVAKRLETLDSSGNHIEYHASFSSAVKYANEHENVATIKFLKSVVNNQNSSPQIIKSLTIDGGGFTYTHYGNGAAITQYTTNSQSSCTLTITNLTVVVPYSSKYSGMWVIYSSGSRSRLNITNCTLVNNNVKSASSGQGVLCSSVANVSILNSVIRSTNNALRCLDVTGDVTVKNTGCKSIQNNAIEIKNCANTYIYATTTATITSSANETCALIIDNSNLSISGNVTFMSKETTSTVLSAKNGTSLSIVSSTGINTISGGKCGITLEDATLDLQDISTKFISDNTNRIADIYNNTPSNIISVTGYEDSSVRFSVYVNIAGATVRTNIVKFSDEQMRRDLKEYIKTANKGAKLGNEAEYVYITIGRIITIELDKSAANIFAPDDLDGTITPKIYLAQFSSDYHAEADGLNAYYTYGTLKNSEVLASDGSSLYSAYRQYYHKFSSMNGIGTVTTTSSSKPDYFFAGAMDLYYYKYFTQIDLVLDSGEISSLNNIWLFSTESSNLAMEDPTVSYRGYEVVDWSANSVAKSIQFAVDENEWADVEDENGRDLVINAVIIEVPGKTIYTNPGKQLTKGEQYGIGGTAQPGYNKHLITLKTLEQNGDTIQLWWR